MLQPPGADPMLVTDRVDNPAEYAERVVHPTIQVVRTLRNDPIGVMFAKRQIDEAQCKAAREWQRLAVLAGPHLKSSGHLEEPVDGGGHIRDGIAQRQIDAHKQLQRYARLFRPREFRLLVLVLEEGVSAWAATAALFPDDLSHDRRRFVGMWLQELLSILARDMRLAS